MDTAIEILSGELALTEIKLRDEKGNDKGLNNKKYQIQNAIAWLEQLQKFGVDWRKAKVIKLKDIGYCDYRLLIDDETDDRDSWTEVSLDETDRGVKLGGGDVLIVRK